MLRTLEHRMTTIVSGAGRLVVGVSGSPGSLCALRYALVLAYRLDVPLLAALAWVPPGGELADRRFPSPELRRIWADAARKRLTDALDAACGGVPAGINIAQVIIRGAAGPALADIADGDGDVLVVGAGRRGVLSRIWHGQVSRYCLSHAQCPVLAIPHPATARELGLAPGAWAARRRDLTLNRALRDWGPAA
jgi:nucleotide-binding universal stress UspA family protein